MGASRTVPLKLYWHPGRGDYFSTATAQGERDAIAAGYQFIRNEGWISPSSRSGWVPLKLYWHSGRGDNFSTATVQGAQDAEAAGYRFVRNEGWVSPSPISEGVPNGPLKLYWHSGRGDNFSTATVQGAQDAEAAGYQSIRGEGFVYRSEPPPPPLTGTEYVGLSRVSSTSFQYQGTTSDPWNAQRALITTVRNNAGYNFSLSLRDANNAFVGAAVINAGQTVNSFQNYRFQGNWTAQIGGSVASAPSQLSIQVDWRKP